MAIVALTCSSINFDGQELNICSSALSAGAETLMGSAARCHAISLWLRTRTSSHDCIQRQKGHEETTHSLHSKRSAFGYFTSTAAIQGDASPNLSRSPCHCNVILRIKPQQNESILKCKHEQESWVTASDEASFSKWQNQTFTFKYWMHEVIYQPII